MRWTIALAAVGIAVLGVAAFSIASRGSADAATAHVDVGNFYFCAPEFDGSVCETDITAGDTVTWNLVSGSHTVTQCATAFATCPPAGGFDSGFPLGATFSHTFATAGTYFYHCNIHPFDMMGKVVVVTSAVGGIGKLPDVKAAPEGSVQPSGNNSAPFAIAGAAAAILIVISASTWFLRRRRSTR
jgi:plastocyanin